MVVIFICIIAAVVAYLAFTKNGQQIKNRASGTVAEKIKDDAMTPEGAKARYNTAIRDKQEFYQKVTGTYTLVAGKLKAMEEDLQKTKKDILRVQTSINQCLDLSLIHISEPTRH